MGLLGQGLYLREKWGTDKTEVQSGVGVGRTTVEGSGPTRTVVLKYSRVVLIRQKMGGIEVGGIGTARTGSI